MEMTIPKFSLVVLIGPSGSGKSVFARKHFLPTEVLSSDACRGMVADDENDQSVTAEAFELLHFILGKRLAAGRLTVVDATNVQRDSRQPLVRTAREFHCPLVAIAFNLPKRLCEQRNRERPDRDFGPHVIHRQHTSMQRSLGHLKKEGFRQVVVLASQQEADELRLERVPLRCDRRDDRGPFDIIGDVHGCCDELEALLGQLGYQRVELGDDDPVWGRSAYAHPHGRKAIFLGDLVDRGPRVLDTLRLVRNMVRADLALCVPGNHDDKFVRLLRGRDVQVTHGLGRSKAELDALPDLARQRLAQEAADLIYHLVSHYVLDDGGLVVAHAGMKQQMQGRSSRAVRQFALYGETTGETDEFGLPVRHNWAAEYRGRAAVVYGHTPVPEPQWLNRTVNIDTGCVFGGRLTALRWPEKQLVAVPAARTYCPPVRPLAPGDAGKPALTAQQQHDDLLDADDVIGKRRITTRLRTSITIHPANALAALEAMSRFAANPKWLIYLPPTMSPCQTSREEGYLEHPAEALASYRAAGVPTVVCQEKHMGSRAVVVVCRDADAARRCFGVVDEGAGIVYSRTGRRFLDEPAMEAQLLARVRAAMTAAGLWDQLATDWACLDCELMPWSAKARELLRTQYAALGAAARAALPQAVAALEQAARRTDVQAADPSADVPALLRRFRQRQEHVEKYVAAYRNYCWPVESIDDLKLAPFHLLATEGKVHVDRDHVWHMETLARLCRQDAGLLLPTPYKRLDLTDPDAQAEGIRWWMDLTDRGGEGMVVKPLAFVGRGRRGLVQPAVKCRGREYLRIIYGPHYTADEHLERLRRRGLAAKRSLALREFALGIEALERFIRREPLRRVHECVFGVLALESEPVDPRL
jgi:protein phosphatase